jgi:membrane protease subunit (stomatin/prohibitin family)
MGLWDTIKDRLKHELIDIIQFLDDTNNTLVYRFERFNNEIKNNAKCIVREGQAAVFIREGQLADVLGPGTYTLDTKNLPILSTLLGWKYGFESPFKAEVYFVSTRVFTDQKWGTMNPVMIRDPEFGPVRLRAYGTYTMRVKDPSTFIKNVVGTDGRFTIEEVNTQLRNVIVSQIGDALGESKIPMLDLAGRYNELGRFLGEQVKAEFDKLGLELPTLLVENISLPPEVEAALDKRSSMGIVGDLNAYAKYQTAEAIRDAAKNPGMAGAVVGMGMGNVFGGMMGQAASQPYAPPVGPPPVPAGVAFFVAVNGVQQGPFDLGSLAGKARAGELTRDSLVWSQGMGNWTRASEVAALAGVFAPTPPPIPG